MKEKIAGAAAALALAAITAALFWVNVPRVPEISEPATAFEEEDVSEPEPEPEPVRVAFLSDAITLCVGEEAQVAQEDERIVLTSDASETAAVERNVVRGVSAGSAVIRALGGEEDNYCRITVLEAPREISLSAKELTLFVGEAYSLTCASDPLGVEPIRFFAGEEISFTEKEQELVLKGEKAGETDFTAKTYNGLEADCHIKVVEKTDKAYLGGFEIISQWPELPTGCEVTALTMAMRYLGFELGKCELADQYLPKTWDFMGDVRYVFLGDPRDRESAGCYAPCIVTTAEKYLEDKELSDVWQVLNLTDSEPEKLYDYVAKGTPVLVWVTSSMREPYVNYYCYGEDGEVVPWMFPEHCAVLVGYDMEAGTVQIADSEAGYIRTTGIETFEKIYGMMFSQAIVVVKK